MSRDEPCIARFLTFLAWAPVTFLRHKRLCAIHSILKDSNPETVTVAEVAMQQGFVELGRFAHYYRSLFGEYPSETLGSRRSKEKTAHRTGHDRETGSALGAANHPRRCARHHTANAITTAPASPNQVTTYCMWLS